MKKFLIWLTLASLLFTGFALAERSAQNDQPADTPAQEEEGTVEIPMISGVIEEINDAEYDADGKLLSATLLVTGGDYPQVEVHYEADTTVLEGEEALSLGDYVYVLYNGVMTRSLPPQITAERISIWKQVGTVTEIGEDGFMMHTEEQGDVWVNATEEQLAAIALEDEVTVYSNGVMTMSLPPQITAVWMTTAAE